jgi:hypothetical protein
MHTAQRPESAAPTPTAQRTPILPGSAFVLENNKAFFAKPTGASDDGPIP